MAINPPKRARVVGASSAAAAAAAFTGGTFLAGEAGPGGSGGGEGGAASEASAEGARLLAEAEAQAAGGGGGEDEALILDERSLKRRVLKFEKVGLAARGAAHLPRWVGGWGGCLCPRRHGATARCRRRDRASHHLRGH